MHELEYSLTSLSTLQTINASHFPRSGRKSDRDYAPYINDEFAAADRHRTGDSGAISPARCLLLHYHRICLRCYWPSRGFAPGGGPTPWERAESSVGPVSVGVGCLVFPVWPTRTWSMRRSRIPVSVDAARVRASQRLQAIAGLLGGLLGRNAEASNSHPSSVGTFRIDTQGNTYCTGRSRLSRRDYDSLNTYWPRGILVIGPPPGGVSDASKHGVQTSLAVRGRCYSWWRIRPAYHRVA